MQKASPVWLVAGVVLVLVLGGLVGFSLLSGKKSSSSAAQPNASLSAEPEPQNPQLAQQAQREHAAMTQRALAALEEKKKEQAAAPEVASETPEAEKPKAAPKKSGGAQAPAADKLKALGDGIASDLGKQ